MTRVRIHGHIRAAYNRPSLHLLRVLREVEFEDGDLWVGSGIVVGGIANPTKAPGA